MWYLSSCPEKVKFPAAKNVGGNVELIINGLRHYIEIQCILFFVNLEINKTNLPTNVNSGDYAIEMQNDYTY
jgi:hypothetical protein